MSLQEYPDLPSYPVYATLNDTQEYLQTYIDPTFNVTTALVRVLCDIILRLSDSAILPFNVTGYQHIMERGMRGLKLYESQLQDANLRLGTHFVAVRKILYLRRGVFSMIISNVE